MKPLARILTLAILLAAPLGDASGMERFPPPDFDSGYKLPQTTHPGPRAELYDRLDVAALVVALAASSYLALKLRSRNAMFLLMVLSLLYFGFWRKGCICSIGAVQNVTLAAFDRSYAIPLAALAFFFLPLFTTLLFGRTFCAAVCPLGAAQDLVLLHPVGVPRWLEPGLRVLPYVYLGAAVLFAATGSAFVICEYDPFVSFFRLSGSLSMLTLGACVLLIGLFVGRPYCRFLCPYGALLGLLSRVSKWRVTITPDKCVHCRLCEDACPFGAIQAPRPPEGRAPASGRRRGLAGERRRLAGLLLLLPLLAVLGGWGASRLNVPLSRMHWKVRLAERMRLEETGKVKGETDATKAFRGTGRPVEELYGDARGLRRDFAVGGWLLGGFVGLAVGTKLVGLSIRRRRADYEADRAACLACGRCFAYCPVEHKRWRAT